MKQCLQCGSDFDPKTKRGVYCSDLCRVKYSRKRNKIIQQGSDNSKFVTIKGVKIPVTQKELDAILIENSSRYDDIKSKEDKFLVWHNAKVEIRGQTMIITTD